MLERNAAITIGTGGLISNGISSGTIGGSSANHTYGAEYSGENAVALGAYYRPNEDLMFSIGSTMGNGENMLNGFAGTNANVDTTKLFPDVPSNHWAYEAVAAMSRSGLVEGYPKSYKPIMTSSRY